MHRLRIELRPPGSISDTQSHRHKSRLIQKGRTSVVIKVRKRAKIRNRYNQAPHLTQDTNGRVKTSQLDITYYLYQIFPLHF